MKGICTILESFGFDIWQTGGGCTAYGRNEAASATTGPRYILITDDDGFGPDDDSDGLMIGFYDDDCTGEAIALVPIATDASVDGAVRYRIDRIEHQAHEWTPESLTDAVNLAMRIIMRLEGSNDRL